MRYRPNENGSGLGPNVGGAICNCVYQAPQPSLPSNTVAPVISGNPLVLSTLTTTNGTWTGFPVPTFTYQWLRNGAVIGGATIITYVTQVADVGQQITCRVTGTNSAGSVNAISNVITPLLVTPPTVVYDVLYNNGNTTSYVQYTNGVGVSFTYDPQMGLNPGYLTMTLKTNSNANNVQWSMSNNANMNMTSSGGTVSITGSGSYPGGTQALYFTIPQTTFNNVTYAAFSGSINVTATNVS
jgi:hypothetical protein